MKLKLYLATIVILLLIIVNTFFILRGANHDEENLTGEIGLTKDTKAYILPVSEASYIPIFNSNISQPVIEARAAMVYDVRSSRFLYTKNINQKLPVASLTKLLTAVATVENLNLADAATVPREAIKVDGEKQDLYLNEKITVENLLRLMLIKSSNDAAYALVTHAKNRGVDLIEKMNEKTTILGMTDSYFKDPAGLNDEAYSTADDLIKLVTYSLKYPVLWEIMRQEKVTIKSADDKVEHNIETTNRLFGQVPGIVGGKTGNTDGALGCMMLVVEVSPKNDKIISIVLGSNQRFADTKNLIEWAREAYRWK